MIDVLVPVLGRPHHVTQMALTLDKGDGELLFLCSPEDGEGLEAAHATGARVVVMEWEAGPGDYARKINRGYALTSAPYVFQAATDLLFHPGWAEAALQVAERSGAGVVGTNDLANPMVMRGRHSTHSLVRRQYVEEEGGGWDGPGVLLHEGYDHQYVDNELVVAAMQRGRWAFARNSVVQHLHPVFGHGDRNDPTYVKAMRAGVEDGRLYRDRERSNR